jgi:RNA-directed DNA polymerase
MPTFLQGIAKKAQEHPKHRFGNLYELLNEPFLKECWRDIRKEAASGVDRLSAQDYERNLDENMHNLVERLKRKQYRAKLVRRQYIPKGDGKLRPWGSPPSRISGCNSPSRGYCKPSTSRTFCAVARAIVRMWERWMPSTG